MLLARLLGTALKEGTLNIIDVAGKTHRFVGTRSPEVTVRLHNRALEYQLYINPDLVLGEAYVNGTLTVEQGELRDFLRIVMLASNQATHSRFYAFSERLRKYLRVFHQYNPINRSRRNVAHHYDLPDVLYDLFLDTDKQYSCAYFEHPADDLETAQAAKKRHLAAKLSIEKGHRVLDIGSGWGGLALYLAEDTGANVTGLTLSQSQFRVANQRSRNNENVQFHLRDYREENGRFDRIVSVGMFEHVGVNNFQQYFNTISDLLCDNGTAVIHTIGRRTSPGSTNPWIRKYIFPGGYTPALSEIMQAVEASGLWLADVEVLRLHYAYTLRAWYERFLAHREQISGLLDEKFCRMWEFYLCGSEASFLYGDQLVFQLQLSKARDAVPLTRNYIDDFERMRSLESARPLAGRLA
jgi:cyclopropane-fatty-acyl-phospholipid synthase